mmetsp:Transcript_94711/g.171026  ORF Transcript_94711/g.171026 Transcript_94711/m.171026 type:complete len:257 (+) Transcript_94711:109-879(+)
MAARQAATNKDLESSSEDEITCADEWTFKAAAKGVPYRLQQVLISWVFIVASVALLLDFLSLQALVREGDNPDFFAELCNWFGVLSCISWFLGFALLIHWLRSVGATSMGVLGASCKLVAAILFNLQPMTGTMNDPLLGGGAGLWWSNTAGITFFHVGNIISCLDFYLHTAPGADTRKGWLYHGNLPITGMWVYQLATWFLVASNYMACGWGGDVQKALMPTAAAPVFICQVLGASLLLLGSVVYAVWCDGLNLQH